VSILAPSASTPSTRQLFTGTPLSSTVQAPQLPLLQPSFAPVSLSVSRRTSNRLSRGSQRNCAGSLLTVVDTCDFLVTGFAYSFGLVSCNLCGAGFQPALTFPGQAGSLPLGHCPFARSTAFASVRFTSTP